MSGGFIKFNIGRFDVRNEALGLVRFASFYGLGRSGMDNGKPENLLQHDFQPLDL